MTLDTDTTSGVSSDTGSTTRTFGIGDLAREFGVSLRTLRFYEDKGLIEPDRAGTTRIYSEAHRNRLQTALFGKRIGLALAGVGRLLEAQETGRHDETAEILRDQRGVLEERIAADRAALGELDARLASLR